MSGKKIAAAWNRVVQALPTAAQVATIVAVGIEVIHYL